MMIVVRTVTQTDVSMRMCIRAKKQLTLKGDKQ